MKTKTQKTKRRPKSPKLLTKKREGRKREQIYAYTITDVAFPDFMVLTTANGWWREQGKVENIIKAYKIDSTDEEACAYTGITMDQLRYFKEVHPEFSLVKSACLQVLSLAAKNNIAKSIHNDVAGASAWYIERKYGKTLNEGATQRELYDNIASKVNNAILDVKKVTIDYEEKKHTFRLSGGNTDARQDGAGDDATTSTNTTTKKANDTGVNKQLPNRQHASEPESNRGADSNT